MPNNVKFTDIFKNFLNGVQLDFRNRSSLLHPLLPFLLQAAQVGSASIKMKQTKNSSQFTQNIKQENVKAFFYNNGDDRKLRLYIDEENLSDESRKILLSIDPDFVVEIPDDVQEKNIFNATLTTQSIYKDYTSEYALLKLDFDKNINYPTNNFYRTISAILKYNEDNVTILKHSGSSICDKNLIYPNNQNNQLNRCFFTMDNGPSTQICKNSQLPIEFEVIANKQNNELSFHFSSLFPDNRLTIKTLNAQNNDIGYGKFNTASNVESIAYNDNELTILNKNGTYYQYNPNNSSIYPIHNPSSTTISTPISSSSRDTTTTSNQNAQSTNELPDDTTSNNKLTTTPPKATSEDYTITTTIQTSSTKSNSYSPSDTTSKITNPIDTTVTTSKFSSGQITTSPPSSLSSSKTITTSPSGATTIPHQTTKFLEPNSTTTLAITTENPISKITPISSHTTSSDITDSQNTSTTNVQTTQPVYTEPTTNNTRAPENHNKTTTIENPNQHLTTNYDLIPKENLSSTWIALIAIGIFALIGAIIFGFVFKKRKTNKICISHGKDDNDISMTDLRRNSNDTYSTIVDNTNEIKIQDKNDEKRKNLEKKLINKTNSITNLLKPLQQQKENLKQNYSNYQFWEISSRILNWRINKGKVNRDDQITNEPTRYSDMVSTIEQTFIHEIIENINFSQDNLNNFDIILPSDYHENKKTFDEKKAKIIEILKFLHKDFSKNNCPVFYNALNNKEKSPQINDLFSGQQNIYFSNLKKIVNQLKIDKVFKKINNLLNEYLETFKDLDKMTKDKNSLESTLGQFLALIELYKKELEIFKEVYNILKDESMMKNIENYSRTLDANKEKINEILNPFANEPDSPKHSPQPSPKLSRQNSQGSIGSIKTEITTV